MIDKFSKICLIFYDAITKDSVFLQMETIRTEDKRQETSKKHYTIRRMSVLLGAFLIFSAYFCNGREDINYAALRKNMVETQIKKRGIKDKRVLNAMMKVERHLFVPEANQAFAYEDMPLPIGHGQTISQPYIVALMTELLHLKGNEKVLEIGTGSGYQAAILAELASQVWTIEIIEPLALKAGETLKKLGYKNIQVKCGDGYLGWKEYAPFDRIIVTCAPPFVPEPLVEQLAEGGKMVIPIGETYQELKLFEKIKGKLAEKTIVSVKFVPMTGEYIKKTYPKKK